MSSITLGEVATVVGFLVTLIGGLEFLYKRINKLFDLKLSPINEKIDSNFIEQNKKIEGIQEAFNEKLDDISYKQANDLKKFQEGTLISRRKQVRKEYVQFTSELRRGVEHTIDEFKSMLELEDEYDEICKTLNIPNHVFEEEVEYLHACYKKLSEKEPK